MFVRRMCFCVSVLCILLRLFHRRSLLIIKFKTVSPEYAEKGVESASSDFGQFVVFNGRATTLGPCVLFPFGHFGAGFGLTVTTTVFLFGFRCFWRARILFCSARRCGSSVLGVFFGALGHCEARLKSFRTNERRWIDTLTIQIYMLNLNCGDAPELVVSSV